MAKQIKNPCIMMAQHVSFGDKPDFIHVVGKDVWITDFDTFMDAGFADECRTVVIGDYPPEESKKARDAYDYFYEGGDSGEYGEPMEPFEDEHRRRHFMALWEFITGEVVEFKVKG